MNPYSEDEMKYFNQIRQMVGDQLLTRIAPSMEEIERVNTYGAYEQPKWVDEQPFLRDQLERWGVFNLVRGLNERGDRSMTAIGAVSPRSMIRVDKMPEHVRPVYSPDDKLEQLMELAWMGPSDVGVVGWTAFHGTPHKWAAEKNFPAGRARLDKIGTGEGAQARGWGIYGADAKAVGEEYARNVPGISYDNFVDSFDQKLNKKYGVTLDWDNGLKKHVVIDESTGENALSRLDAVDMEDFRKIESGRYPEPMLYKLDIPDDVAPKLLDWDKPLSEQSEEVKRALQNIDPSIMTSRMGFTDATGTAYYGPPRDGASLYDALSRKLGGTRMIGSGDKQWGPVPISNDQAASEYLASIGIPGNKYLDAMSRGKDKGTYNYVIWDQDVLNRTVPLSINDQPTGLKPGDYPLSAQDVLNQLQP